MDLVDIDKVLDEFELNEDKDIKSNSKPDSITPVTHESYRENTNCSLRRTTVNVSKVFHSLNEYVNAGPDISLASVSKPVEFINAIEDVPVIVNDHNDSEPNCTIDSDESLSSDLSTDSSKSSLSNKLGFTPSTASTATTGKQNNDHSNDDHSDEQDQHLVPLTSTTDTQSLPQTITVDDEPEIIKTEDNEQQIESLSRERSSSLSSITSSSSSESSSVHVEDLNTLSGALSSTNQEFLNDIVQTTTSYAPLTMPTTSEFDSSEPKEIINNSGGLVGQEEQMKDCVDEKIIEQNQLIPSVSVSKSKVCFESTMDDVSDTELESYLMELELEGNQADQKDIKDQSNHVDVKSVPSTEASNVLSDIEENPMSLTDSETDDDSELNIDSNHQNADSLSQASTVEYADLQGQTDFEALANQAISSKEQLSLAKIVESDVISVEIPQRTAQETEPFPSDTIEPESLDSSSDERGIQLNENLTSQPETPPTIARPNSLILSSTTATVLEQSIVSSSPPPTDYRSSTSLESNESQENSVVLLGQTPPYWVPDTDANACMQCGQKFTILKRRHHCRACGLVLCVACCSLRAKLAYIGESDVRVCVKCFEILKTSREQGSRTPTTVAAGNETITRRPPNPNNPMEYCSVIPPHQQVNPIQSPISVMVPVGVLKREGSTKTNRKEKNVMFSDGIRPGCDLTELDNNWDQVGTSSSATTSGRTTNGRKSTNRRIQTPMEESPSPRYTGKSYMPTNGNTLPPIAVGTKTEMKLVEVVNDGKLLERLHTETLKFALQRNFFVLVKVINLSCCINKTVINFTTQGMYYVGQDEIVILLELLPDDAINGLPKDMFIHFYEIFYEAEKGQTITELGFSMPNVPNFLNSREHGGFLYIRTTYQCMQGVELPESPFLIGILIHLWEVPWAKILPLRLMLRLGALYRYYPSPHISTRKRDAVYAEIDQTIINFLADFRTYSYTLPTIKGMYIHMENRKTNVLIPRNRYDQVVKAINNFSDHILALGANFSKDADGHLVCIQNTDASSAESKTYTTQAINIQGQPRNVTGASFLVFNGALKSTSGYQSKCSIVEDGLMIQVLPAKMAKVRKCLQDMNDIDIVCGPVDAEPKDLETVCLRWVENDSQFNIGVYSPIDKKLLAGVPSIRVHRGLEYPDDRHFIHWTEVFIIKLDEESRHGKDPVDISKLGEQIAKSTTMALIKFLELLVTNGCTKIGLRVTLDQEDVCYEAGSQGTRLAPLYMKALDNELIPILHQICSNLQLDTQVIIELIFHILDSYPLG